MISSRRLAGAWYGLMAGEVTSLASSSAWLGQSMNLWLDKLPFLPLTGVLLGNANAGDATSPHLMRSWLGHGIGSSLKRLLFLISGRILAGAWHGLAAEGVCLAISKILAVARFELVTDLFGLWQKPGWGMT